MWYWILNSSIPSCASSNFNLVSNLFKLSENLCELLASIIGEIIRIALVSRDFSLLKLLHCFSILSEVHLRIINKGERISKQSSANETRNRSNFCGRGKIENVGNRGCFCVKVVCAVAKKLLTEHLCAKWEFIEK